MKLYYPLLKYTQSQKFGENLSPFYKQQGYLGHTGIDLVSFHGDNVYSACDGKVSSVQNKDNPDLGRYREVAVVTESGGIFYEVSYGHLDHIFVTEGQEVVVGDLIGTEGNTGPVSSGGVEITTVQKQNGNTIGTHLHFQVRLCKPIDPKEDVHNIKYLDGFQYEIVGFDNGYYGCIDPQPFMTTEPLPIAQSSNKITATLRYGSKGDQIKLLQEKIGGLIVDGSFGVKTLSAVKVYQKNHGLVADGIVGALTRKVLNG